MANYQQELNNFKKQWNLPDYDLNEYANNAKGLRYAEAFLTGDSVDLSVGGEVVRWFSKTLEAYFQANTSLNADGKYMSSFDPQAFYNSFKTLAQAKFDDDAEKTNGTPLQVKEVLKNQKQNLESVIEKNMSKYQKPLPTLWAEKLKKGSMTPGALIVAATNVIDDVESELPSSKIGLEDKITNVVAAYEAMKQFRATRSGFLGWLWKVIFRERNEIEETNLSVLESQVNRLRSNGYPVDKITADLTGKTVLGHDLSTEKKAQEAAAAKTQENPVKQAFQPIKVKPCAETIRNTYPETSKKVIKEIIEKLPVTNKFGGLFREQTLELMINNRVLEKFDELNVQFDKDMQNGNQKNAIAKLVRESFMVAQSVSVMATSGVDMNKVDACAIIAKLFIDNFTAVSIYPELSGIANEYIKDNAALYNEIDAKELTYSQEIDKYEVDYVPSENYFREPVFSGDNNPFAENSGKIAPPVVQQPQKDVPTLNNN